MQHSAVFFRGKFYDQVRARRRGVSAITWSKPKLKFDFNGAVFDWKKGSPNVEEINLQSFYDEPGEETYMREVVALKVRQAAWIYRVCVESRVAFTKCNGHIPAHSCTQCAQVSRMCRCCGRLVCQPVMQSMCTSQ